MEPAPLHVLLHRCSGHDHPRAANARTGVAVSDAPASRMADHGGLFTRSWDLRGNRGDGGSAGDSGAREDNAYDGYELFSLARPPRCNPTPEEEAVRTWHKGGRLPPGTAERYIAQIEAGPCPACSIAADKVRALDRTAIAGPSHSDDPNSPR